MLGQSSIEWSRECIYKEEIFLRQELVRILITVNVLEEHASAFEGEFADESFHVKHTEIGLIGMCKKKGF